ncbi:hypothetical protein V2J92_12425 [Pseudomonas alliivorans]|nr:hypothetical protein [Pseudomonas alliivorans]
MARDDFKQSTIKKLRDRVAHRCSNPNCRVATSAPQDEEGVTNVGKAAHICAASPGGARYDVSMTSNERKAFSNGIWLCAIHADEIDRDFNTYTVEKLRSWKKQAEAAAKAELGKRQPAAQDAPDLLAMALTGMPKSFLPSAIQNAHRATAQVLSQADPRFDVVTRYDPHHGTVFQVNAKENVQLAMTVGGRDARMATTGFDALFEHGQSLELDMTNVAIQGSPLFDAIVDMTKGAGGKMQIFRPPTRVIQKIMLTNPDTLETLVLDDMPGEIVWGTKSFCLRGESMAGMLKLVAEVGDGGAVSNVNFNISVENWQSRPVDQLPWFSKIAQFAEAALNGWKVSLIVELDGERLYVMSINLRPDGFKRLATLMTYLQWARRLTEFLGTSLNVDLTSGLADEDYVELKDSVDAIDGYYKPLESIKFPIRSAAKMDEDEVSRFRNQRYRFKEFDATERKSINVFGQAVSLPPVHIMVRNGLLELVSYENSVASFHIYPLEDFDAYCRFATKP